MSIPKQIPRQRDFSAGELDESAFRRDDTDLLRAGGRQMSNKRILATGGLDQRPGRPALNIETVTCRADDIRISADAVFRFCFISGGLKIRDRTTGTTYFTGTSMPWTDPLSLITWAVIGNDVIVAYPNVKPKILRWGGGTSWTALDFAEAVEPSGVKRTIFTRLGYPGVTMQPSDYSGSVTLTFSASVGLTAAHVGKRMRYVGRQMTITAVGSSSSATATVIERLYPTQVLQITGANEQFQIGDAVTGNTTNATGQLIGAGGTISVVDTATPDNPGSGYVVSDVLTVIGGTGTSATLTVASVGGSGEITGLTVSTGGSYLTAPTTPASLSGGTGTGGTADLTFTTSSQTVTVVCSSNVKFSGSEVIVGPNGSGTATAAFDVAPGATTNWDEEVMNDVQGWPGSVFADQNRLGFCDFPAIREGIAWSAIDSPDDFEVGADPDDAIFEIIGKKCRVYNVVASDDEFVFTNIGVFYIPISEANPLKPGSVAFRDITGESASQVRPVKAVHGVVYVNEGGKRVIAIVPTGQTARPYLSRDVSQFHSHLINSPIGLAVSTGTGQFPESYLYIINNDGTVSTGRYNPTDQWVGFVPWSSPDGDVEWVSCLESETVFTTAYTFGYTTRRAIERLDADNYLDASTFYNAAPVGLAPPIGYGPLWYLAGATVALYDGNRPRGTRQVNSTGSLVPLEGDDFTSATLICGLAWTETFEPFVPHADSGRSAGQATRKRKIGAIMVTAKHRTGFTVAGRRIPPWRQGDNVSDAPPLREETHKFRLLGRSYDPRVEHFKDIPGPCRLIEFTTDVTV